MQSVDKEHGVVVAYQGKAWHCHLHGLMKPLLVGTLQCLRLHRIGIIIKGRRYVRVVLVETLHIVLGVHQPLGIAVKRDNGTGIFGVEFVQFVEYLRQLRHAPRIEYHHVLLARHESFGKLFDRGIDVGNAVIDFLAFQLLAQSKGKVAFARGRVVAVHEDRMHIGKAVHESLDSSLVKCLRALVYLEYLLVIVHVITIDGEGNDHLDAIGLAESGKRCHLLAVERSEDDVTLVGTLLQ